MEYKLDKIIGIQKKRNQWQYHVVWKGYPLSEATWEPLKDLVGNATEAILDFHSAHPTKPRPQALEKTEHMPEGTRFVFFNKDGTNAPTPPIPTLAE